MSVMSFIVTDMLYDLVLAVRNYLCPIVLSLTLRTAERFGVRIYCFVCPS